MGSSALAVVCVLKTGGDFQAKHVLLLKRQVHEHLSIPHRFICLSDVSIPGVECVPLVHDWPGWWNKIELFRHDFGSTFYMDLDTVIVGSLDELASYDHQFTALQSLSANQKQCLNSGLMAWTGARMDLYEAFAARSRFHIATCNRAGNWGDQGFIHHHVGRWEAWQDLFPRKVISFKKHLHQKLTPPAETSVVCFHGKPRPWEVRFEWVPR